MSDKVALRRILRAVRADRVEQLGSDARTAAETVLAARVYDAIAMTDRVAAYVAVGAEPRLTMLFDRLGEMAIPHVTSRTEPMRFLHWSPGAPLMPGPLGLRQPHESATPMVPTLILAPLIGFDRQGGRLGQGGGYYDRAFARYPAARRIGIAWSVQEVGAIPLDPWDMPLHAVATEAEWITMP